VNRVAHRLFNPDNFTFVVVGQPPFNANGGLAPAPVAPPLPRPTDPAAH
jgi:hypothetical protein